MSLHKTRFTANQRIMKDKITVALEQLEKEHNIKILWACETGSRAWGFPSPDSDYDVRFIYVHQPDWYLSLNEKKDNLDLMLENKLIDLSGWDLRKTLRLLAKSNVSVLERMQGEIVYLGDEVFQRELKNLAQDCFSPIATMHHYLSMSKSFWDKISEKEEVRLKDFFYAFRTAIAGKWIREKEEVPPLVFREMYDILDAEVCSKLDDLIDLKAEKEEGYHHVMDSDLLDFLKETILENESMAQTLSSSKSDWDEMDDFLRKWAKWN